MNPALIRLTHRSCGGRSIKWKAKQPIFPKHSPKPHGSQALDTALAWSWKISRQLAKKNRRQNIRAWLPSILLPVHHHRIPTELLTFRQRHTCNAMSMIPGLSTTGVVLLGTFKVRPMSENARLTLTPVFLSPLGSIFDSATANWRIMTEEARVHSRH